MKIGQMVFFRCAPVPDHASYAAKGQYNGDTGAVGSKGVR
jgi:deoxycytidine triphosphate deaminase